MAENPDKRAKELHSFFKNRLTKNAVTIAVGNSEENISIVGTSEGYLRSEIRKNLKSHEIAAKPTPENHAEEDVLNTAAVLNIKITEIGASRPICSDCEEIIKKQQIKSATEFSGKKSAKRK